jgi:anti-anti-sigma factor
MVTAHTAVSWRLSVDRGPDWMFVRLHPTAEGGYGESELAEKIWSVLDQNFTYRLVLELDQLEMLQSQLIAQLVMLSKRIHSHSGMMRLCGLSAVNQEVLHVCRLNGCLPNYDDRSSAVKGEHRPLQPR